MKSSEAKVIIIGLDGMPHDLFTKLATLDGFPTISRLMKTGAIARMATVIPPHSPPAWASISTGMNPGKHGIFDFVRRTDDYKFTFSDSSLLRGKTVWDVAGSHGLKVIVVNVPITYPAYPVNGVLISGFPAPNSRKACFPKRVLSDIRRNVGDYVFDIDAGYAYSIGNPEEFVKRITYMTIQRSKALMYLLENYDWDLAFGVFTAIDRFHHVFWRYVKKFYDPLRNHKHSPIIKKYNSIIEEYYRMVDRILGDLVKLSSQQNAQMVIVSDHGFELATKFFGINRILQRFNYLRTKQSTQLVSKDRIFNLFMKNSLLRKFFNQAVFMKHRLSLLLQALLPSSIDLKSTIAYYSHKNGITVRSGFEPFTNELVDHLYNVIDPETKTKVVEKIFLREEIFSGPFVDKAPSLVVTLREGYEPRRESQKPICKIREEAPESRMTGVHQGISSIEGSLFCAYGSLIHPKRDFHPTVFDIFPTVLSILGLPVPKDVDGRCLHGVFLDRESREFKRASALSQRRWPRGGKPN